MRQRRKPIEREPHKGAKQWCVIWLRELDKSSGETELKVAYTGRSLASAEFFAEKRWPSAKAEGWHKFSVEESEKGRRHNCFKVLHKKTLKCTDCLTEINGAYFWNGVAFCEPCFQYAKENPQEAVSDPKTHHQMM